MLNFYKEISTFWLLVATQELQPVPNVESQLLYYKKYLKYKAKYMQLSKEN
jgi:hypothetical protein